MDYKNPSELVEQYCDIYNDFMLNLFFFLKFILGFVLIFIGLLTLLKLRGIYLQQKLKQEEKENDQLIIVRITLGIVYIFLGVGILSNFLIYLLIWTLDPLPDPFVFKIISTITDLKLEDLDNKYEKTLLYSISLGSFIFLLELILSIYYFTNSNRLIHNPHSALLGIVGGLIGCLVFGFTTCFPLFL